MRFRIYICFLAISGVGKHFSVHRYLYSLDTSADDLFVVVFGAEWTRMLALPQEVETTTVARPLRTVAAAKETVKNPPELLIPAAMPDVPWHGDVVISRHRGIAPQPDGG